MPRLFTSLLIPENISGQISRLQSGIKNIHWVAPENFHLTLRFLGDISPMEADAVIASLEKIALPSFDLQLQGVGFFGKRNVNILWAGIAPNLQLERLQKKSERAVIQAGLPPELRKFSPHLTLARPQQLPARAIIPYLEANHLFQTSVFRIDEFVLMSAREGRGGGPYVIEQRFPLIQ